MGISIIIIIVLLVVFLVGANFLVINLQKRKIRKSAEKKGWKTTNISFRMPAGGNNLSGYQKFNVQFTDERGRKQNRKCRLRGPYSEVEWID